jgi:hypothetical protein
VAVSSPRPSTAAQKLCLKKGKESERPVLVFYIKEYFEFHPQKARVASYIIEFQYFPSFAQELRKGGRKKCELCSKHTTK